MENMWKRVLSFVLVLAMLVPNFATIATATEGEAMPTEEVITVLSEAEEETPAEEPEVIAEEETPEESEEVVPEESEEVVPEESEEVIPEESEEVVPEESEEVVPEESEEVIPEESEEVVPEESEEVIPEESEEVVPETTEVIVVGGEIVIEETIEVADEALTEESEPEEEIVVEGTVTGEVCTFSGGLDENESLEGYIQAILKDEDTTVYGEQGRNSLDAYRKYLYDQVVPMIAAIAQGNTDGYLINGLPAAKISEDELLAQGFTLSWTKEELGVSQMLYQDTNGNWKITQEANDALAAKLGELWQGEKFMNALQTDYPFDLYWWGKGYAPSGAYTANEETLTVTALTLFIVPAAQYSEKDADENATGVLDPSTIADLQTTLATVKTNAENIVESFSDRESYTDFNRLSNYKKAICDLTGYDFNAPGTYGTDSNPWQLLWVFDGDPDTEVVCEGYSKAFQYLYDLTFEKGYFDGDVYCYLASGEMDGGAHMWNVVDFYGKSYLVDVTNSDPTMGTDDDGNTLSAIGWDGELFMVGGNGSVEDGYTYTFYADTDYEKDVLFTYDADIVDTYGSALRLSTSNPGQAELEAALMHCVYMSETSEYDWYWVLKNDVTITDDMTINATLHVGDSSSDQVEVAPVTLTVAEGATLTVPAGVEFENNGTIVVEAGGSITGTGTYSGNKIDVREGGSLTLAYADGGETEVKIGQLGFMWLEWNDESQQLYVPKDRQPDFNMISAPGQINAGVFCYYDANDALVYVPVSELVSGNESAVRLEAVPNDEVNNGDINDYVTRVFIEGDFGESSVISHTAEDGTVYQLVIRLQMQEDGFYSEAKRDEDCYITSYKMHPLREENAFYFNFSREGWEISGTPAVAVDCGDDWQEDVTIAQIGTSDIYKITLSDELVNSDAAYNGFSVILTYDITNGTDQEGREPGIWCYLGDLWDSWDTAFRINGQGMMYFPEYDGFLGPVEGSDRLVVRTLPDGVTYDYDTRTLYLNNATLTNLEASGEEIPVLNVHLTGDNFITAEDYNHAIGLRDGAQLNILGDGSLTVSAPESESAPDPIILIQKRSSLTIGGNANVTLEGRDEDVLDWHLCGISGDGTGSLILEDDGTLTTVNGDNPESGNYCGICTGVGYITLRGGTLNVDRLERYWGNVPNSLTMEGGTLNAGHVYLEQAMELRYGELNTGFLEHYSYLAIGGDQNNQTMTVNVSSENGPAVDSYGLLHLMTGANATFTNTNPNDEGDVGLFTRNGMIMNGGTLNATGSTGIYFETDQGAQFEMSGGTVNASGLWGFHVKGGRVNLMRGTLNATGEGDANQNEDGILHVFGMLLDEGATMTINGGNGHTFKAVDNDDNTPEGVYDALSKALGIQNGGSLVMNGGAINLDGEMALYNVTDEEAAAISGSYAITDENGNVLQLQKQELGGSNMFSISDGADGYASKAKLTAAWADAGITWKVENGVLTISGNGKLADFAVDEAYIPETPWHEALGEEIDSITSVVVEGGITRIGSNAFTAMPNVTNISLPASLQELDPGFAFRNPARFTIAAGGRYYVHNNVIVANSTETEPARVLRASNSFTGTFTPPEGVTVIGDGAFEGITGLESIALDGITEIGYGAFAGAGLKTVVIPEGITVIHSGAFNGLTLDSLTLPVSLETVESNAFDTNEIKELHYSGSASQWANVNIADYNAALQAAIPTMTFGVTEENERDNTDPYLSIFRLENHGDGWFEPEEKWFEEELGMSVGDTYFGMVYLNTWNGTETAGGWLRTPLKASELRVTNLEDYAGLELLSLREAQEYIANNQVNGDYFLRLSIEGNWNSLGAITYSYGEETLQIPVGVHRDGFGYYDGSIVNGSIATNLENEEVKNNAWTEYVRYDPFAKVGATVYALVDDDWVATGLPYVANEEFQGQTWAKVSYWDGEAFVDTWPPEGTTAKLFKIELTKGAPAEPFYLHFNVPVAQVKEDGTLNNNGDVWGKGIDVGIVTGGEENPWYACFDINDVHYDIFEKGVQASGPDGSTILEKLPYGIKYDHATNTITLPGVNAQDVHSLRASYNQRNEKNEISGTNFPNADLTIKLVGNNTMYGNLDTVLAFSDDLNVTITSDEGGSLHVHAENSKENFNENDEPYAFNTVNVERGASLTIAGNASVTAEIDGKGYWEKGNPAHASAIWMDGNNLTVKDSASLTTVVPKGARQQNGWWENNEFVGGYGEIQDFGQLVVEDHATVNTGRINIPDFWEYDEGSKQDYYTGHSGALIINGGTVNVTPSSNYNVWEENGETRTEYWFAGIHNNRGTIQVNGGTLNINAPAYVAGENNSFTAINMDGGTMTVDKIDDDSTTVNVGKVIVNGTELNDGGWKQSGDIENACGLRLGYGDNDNRTYPASVTVNDGFLFLGGNGYESSSIGHDAHSGTFTVNGGTVVANGNAHFEGRVKQTGGELEFYSGEVSFSNMVQAQGGVMHLNSWQIRLNDTARLRIENDAKVLTAAWNYDSTEWMEHFIVESNAYVEVKGGLLEVVCENFSVGLMMKGEFLQTGGVVDIRIENNRDDSEEIHGDYFEQAVFATGLMQLDGGKMNLNQVDPDKENAYVPAIGYHQVYEQGEPQWNVLENPDGKLVVNGGTLNVAGSQGGILLESAMEINGGEVNATVTTENEGSAAVGVYDFGLGKTSLTITGGTLNANGTIVGMHIQAPVEITGGSVNATITTDLNRAAAVLIENNDNKASLTITGGEHTFTAPVEGSNDAYMSKGLLVVDAPVVVNTAEGETVTVLIKAECTVAEFTYNEECSRMEGNKLIFTSLMDNVTPENAERWLQMQDVTDQMPDMGEDVTVCMHYLDENQDTEGTEILYNTHVRIGDEPLVVKPNEAAIGGVEYATLEEAIEAATDGGFINLIADATKPSKQISKNLVIVPNGYSFWDAEDTLAALSEVTDPAYEVTTNFGIYFISKLPEGQTNVAEINGVKYKTVESALRAAKSGETVVMIADSDESESYLRIPTNVVLNIDKFTLTVNGLTGATGSKVTADTYSNDDIFGKIVTKDLALAEDPQIASDGRHLLPYWDAERGYYVIAKYTLIDNLEGMGLTIDEEAKSLRVVFGQALPGSAKNKYLLDGANDNQIHVVVRASWNIGTDGDVSMDFEFADSFIKTAVNEGKGYGFTLNGYDRVGIDLKNLTIQAMITTEAGVASKGQKFYGINS